MISAAVGLAILALALAWPVPVLLARATWPERSPAAALVVWQAIAIAGGLSMIGALAVYGLSPYGDNLVHTIRNAGSTLYPANVLALSASVLLTGHLLINLIATVVRSERDRRRHAQLVLLLSSPSGENTRLLDTPTPVAYCLPGPFRSITIYSQGLIELLSVDELRAVVEHEKAHVSQRHDVVLIAFRAWRASLPWFPIAYRAQREVGMLIEMLADDRARRVVSSEVLARAITRVAQASQGAAGGVDPHVDARVRRLTERPFAG